MRIVCVDDDPVFLAILMQVLERLEQTQVRGFGDPVEVARLAVLGRLEADLFLLDLEMPGMDGTTLCAALRQSEAHRNTPVVMLSSVRARDRVKAALAAGANDFLNKPLDQLELEARLAMVARVLEERARASALEADMGSLREQAEFAFGYDDPVLPGAETGLVDYLALENHLLSLGWAGLPGTVVMGFRLCNAPWAWQHLERADYFDFLAEAGELILEQMAGLPCRLAYAGSGDFLAVLDRGAKIDAAEMQAGLDAARGPLWHAYRSLGIPAPEIRAGLPVHAPMLGASPRRMVMQARERLGPGTALAFPMTAGGTTQKEVRSARA